MHVYGIVKDAAKEVPLPGAKVSLYVGQKELAVLYSDGKGKFEYKEAASYISDTLVCQVEKEGYQTQKTTYKIEQDEVSLEIELIPGEKEKIELRLSVVDEKGNLLEGVNIALEVEGKRVGSGLSDKYGLFKILLSADLKAKTLNYKTELRGFELVKGEVQLEKETFCEITMEGSPTKKFNWLLPILGIIGGAIGGVIGGFSKNLIVSIAIWGVSLGLALGIGLGDKKKIFGLVIAGIVGFYVGVLLLFLTNPFLLPVCIAIVGLSFGIVLKDKRTISKLMVAGFIGGVIGVATGNVPPLTLAITGLCFGIVMGLPKEEKQKRDSIERKN